MAGKNINKGINVEPLQEFKERVKKDSSQADRNPTMVGKWTGGDASVVHFGDLDIKIGGEGRFNPMQILLASFIACDIDMIAMHASFLGLKINELAIEATGYFNVQSYIAASDQPGSGYQNISYTVKIDAPGITQDQIDYLIERCEKSSPVGDTLTRSVLFELEFVAN